MRPKQIANVVATLALSLPAAQVLAFDCYEVIDKDQNVTYRSTQPPFGMEGEDFKKGQDNLRAKGLHLRWQFSTDCTPTVIQGAGGGALPKSDHVFDPNIVLRATPEYMTGSGRPSSAMLPTSRR